MLRLRGSFYREGSMAVMISIALAWAIAGGLALTVAVTSLFHALSLGPANVVVPIYGMFIVGGSLLGVLFLG